MSTISDIFLLINFAPYKRITKFICQEILGEILMTRPMT